MQFCSVTTKRQKRVAWILSLSYFTTKKSCLACSSRERNLGTVFNLLGCACPYLKLYMQTYKFRFVLFGSDRHYIRYFRGLCFIRRKKKKDKYKRYCALRRGPELQTRPTSYVTSRDLFTCFLFHLSPLPLFSIIF